MSFRFPFKGLLIFVHQRFNIVDLNRTPRGGNQIFIENEVRSTSYTFRHEKAQGSSHSCRSHSLPSKPLLLHPNSLSRLT